MHSTYVSIRFQIQVYFVNVCWLKWLQFSKHTLKILSKLTCLVFTIGDGEVLRRHPVCIWIITHFTCNALHNIKYLIYVLFERMEKGKLFLVAFRATTDITLSFVFCFTSRIFLICYSPCKMILDMKSIYVGRKFLLSLFVVIKTFCILMCYCEILWWLGNSIKYSNSFHHEDHYIQVTVRHLMSSQFYCMMYPYYTCKYAPINTKSL